MKYLLVFGLLLVGCSKPTPHRFVVGDCLIVDSLDGRGAAKVIEVGLYSYHLRNRYNQTYTMPFNYVGVTLTQSDCFGAFKEEGSKNE